MIRVYLFPFLLLLACQENERKNNSLQHPEAHAAEKEKDPCDGPDAGIACCFTNMPAALNRVMTIAREKETGNRIIIRGKILYADSRQPYAGGVLYAYHTDNNGYYSKTGKETGFQKWHGRLHGWCKTDRDGNYEIHTIRPAPYPGNTIPAHIHAALKLKNGNMFYINDFVFSDDKLINQKYFDGVNNSNNPGTLDKGVLELHKEGTVYTGIRDIYIRE